MLLSCYFNQLNKISRLCIDVKNGTIVDSGDDAFALNEASRQEVHRTLT